MTSSNKGKLINSEGLTLAMIDALIVSSLIRGESDAEENKEEDVIVVVEYGLKRKTPVG